MHFRTTYTIDFMMLSIYYYRLSMTLFVIQNPFKSGQKSYTRFYAKNYAESYAKILRKNIQFVTYLLPIIVQPSEHVHQRTLMKALKNPIKWGFCEPT